MNPTKPTRRLAIDVGGTFIDYVLLDETTGEIRIDKEAAYRDEISRQLFVGLDRVSGDGGGLQRVIHGSTLAINTILQEAGAEVGLITNRGFRDVLEIGRGNREDIYDFFWTPASPLVPRYRRREVGGRLDHAGNEIEPLDLNEVAEAARFLIEEAGAEVIAICFLHAYANPGHERSAVDAVRGAYPSLYVTTSHGVAPEWREYERTSSTVLNGYVMPIVSRYFTEVEEQLATREANAELAVMQSNGGVMPPAVCREVPIRTLESGPAGGVVGACALADAIGEPNIICADVGGTSFDVAIVRGGTAVERYRTEVDRRPVLAPTVDVTSIGSGGGSIAWIDDRGSLRVGPESAGSRPGPACFGQGGDRPTVTDCQLLLGRLNPDNFLARRITLDVEAASAAVKRVADPLELDVEEAAAGVVRLAEADMTYALRLTTVERGYDPREFALLAYGGGGALFASALLPELEIPRAIVPTSAAVFSAWGLLFADYREDAALTQVNLVTDSASEQFAGLVGGVKEEATIRLEAHGWSRDSAVVTARADVRFAGQEHTLTVPLAETEDAAKLVELMRAEFAKRHEAQYGQADTERDVEVVTVRATATRAVPHPTIRSAEVNGQSGAAPTAERQVWFSSTGETESASIWNRDELLPGQVVPGPAVIEEWNTTVPVSPGHTARVDHFHNVVISSEGDGV